MAVSRLSQQSIQQSFPKGNTLWDGTTATSAFDSLGSVLLSSAASSIVFSNIPQTYTHLQIRGIAKNGTTAGDTTTILAQFNGDTTFTNYFGRHILYGDGATAAAAADNSSGFTGGAVGSIASQSTSNIFSTNIIDILDYSNTSKYKTNRTLTGIDYNGSGNITFVSSLWMNTNAITSITLKAFATNTFAQHSQFSLYGIK
jgi:hypothetical protein